MKIELPRGSTIGANVTDVDGDDTSATTYQWYRADTSGGARTPIGGATGTTYTPGIADFRKFLVFEVSPKTTTGTPNTGTVVRRYTDNGIRASFSNGSRPYLYPGNTDSSISVSGYTGNATSNAYVYYKISSYPEHVWGISAQLIAPDGTAYNVGTPNINGCGYPCHDKGVTLNLSSEVMNGTWTLRVTNSRGEIYAERLEGWSITF